MSLTTSAAFKTLKSTLDKIVTDKTDGVEDGLVYKKFCKVETMSDNYVDDLENGGPGLAEEVGEGVALPSKQLYEGPQTRYTARKFGLIMSMTEELDEDGKYNDQYANLARRMKRALFKTMDVDAANILNRAFNSAYVGGDGQSLASASHTLPGGGTFSNTLSTAFSPSRAALIVVRQNVMLLPGHDGVTEGYMVKKIVCPVQQLGAWEGIIGSDKVPESGNNEKNIVADWKLELVPVPFWSASSTNWGVITNADNGIKFKMRRKPRARTWYDEPTEVINHGVSARWARGWTDPRGFYGSNA